MNDNFTPCRRIFSRRAESEIIKDYILPDSLPDVKKVLYAFCTVRPISQSIEKDGVRVDGESCCTVIYQSDKDEISCVDYTSPVSFSEAVKGVRKDNCLTAVFAKPDISVRLINPRRLSISQKCICMINIDSFDTVEPYIDGVQSKSLEYKTEIGASCHVCGAVEQGAVYSQDIQIPDTMADAAMPVTVIPSPYITDISVKDGYATVNANMELTVLYRTAEEDGGCYRSFTCSSPVTRTIAVECGDGGICRGDIFVHSLDADLTPDQSGRMRTLQVDLLYGISLICTGETRGNYIADIYSPEFECEASRAEALCRRLWGSLSCHASTDGRAPLEVLGKEPLEVVLSFAECADISVTQDRGKALARGNITVFCIVKCKEGYELGQFNIPFRCECDAKGIPEGAECEAVCRIKPPCVRFDRENVYADTEVYVDMYFSGEENNTILTSLRITDVPVTRQDCSFSVCRLRDGIEKWDVAKRHRVPLSSVRQDGDVLTVFFN